MASLYSRHSLRTGHVKQIICASLPLAIWPFSGKKSSGSTPRQAAFSCQERSCWKKVAKNSRMGDCSVSPRPQVQTSPRFRSTGCSSPPSRQAPEQMSLLGQATALCRWAESPSDNLRRPGRVQGKSYQHLLLEDFPLAHSLSENSRSTSFLSITCTGVATCDGGISAPRYGSALGYGIRYPTVT